ncbi:MAG: OmpH family outer membrane protein [Flavobacteriales bacterium]|jgi:outer membrane protein|tara:strand:- start:774 stop:1286 length:513 start_codon:yes stop_codon:yes gene_type:complete
MKRILLVLSFLLVTGSTWAQKFAYVDSQYILEHIPEYKQAQQQLDDLSYDWQEDIEKAYQEIDQLYRAYQTDKVLLTDKMRQTREDEIIQKEKDAKELQQQRFGTEGDLFKKQEELIRPIQNQIYNAIQEFAKEGRYGVIFDKSSDLLMLYADDNLDKSEKILDKLGYDY